MPKQQALSDILKFRSSSIARPTKKIPPWSGPEDGGSNGGITFSLLSRFLQCRERFRLLVVEGLRPADTFSHFIEYGNMWHVCEEAHASCHAQWLQRLMEYCQKACKKYPTQQELVDHWYNVCKTQFPLYVDFWSKHKDVASRVPMFQEQVFDAPYVLPSGRIVRLRGKWDSVDLVGTGKDTGIYLQENKTKGDINEGAMRRQLSFDLQTMMYLVALQLGKESNTQEMKKYLSKSIRGVRYNVVRRPLSGGKGTIVRHKPTKSNPQGESKEEFYARLGQYIKDEPEMYFMRWKTEVSQGDIDRFKNECLTPLLEQLCWWYDVVVKGDHGVTPPPAAASYRHPFGVRNILDEGGSSDLDEYLTNGSEIGLRRVDQLFTELA